MIGNLMYCLTLCTDELRTNNTFEASIKKKQEIKKAIILEILNHFIHRLFCNQMH